MTAAVEGQPPSGLMYRPEIDGLRAIAVLAVVLYHAGAGGAGFVGVDIFFVISGYLITSLLLLEHARTGGVSLAGFYSRRVRRIFPAAIVVTLAVLGVSSLLLPPAALEHLAQSATASLLFVANYFFAWFSGGYFDTRSEELPLLHMWSLSVEEQFYLAWPMFLLVIQRWRPNWLLPVLAALSVASLLLAEVLYAGDAGSAFYQTPARVWELAAGGMIAASRPRSAPTWLAPAGVALTLAACIWPMPHFPGVGALPAVLGASTILLAVHGGGTNIALRAAPMVWVGKISYSLYLWHWPLLALYRATSIGEGSTRVRVALCLVALVLAAASYRYVEQPFRRLRGRNRNTLAVAVGTMALLSVGALFFGMQANRPAVEDNPLAVRTERDRPGLDCHELATKPVALPCKPSRSTRVAIWGDSMALAWTPMAQAQDPGAAVFTRDACGPLLGYLPEKVFRADRACQDFNEQVAAQVEGLDTVYLVARWEDVPGRFEGLERTLAAVAPKVGRVVVVGPTPQMREDVPRCIRLDRLAACAISRREFDGFASPLLARLRAAATRFPNVTVADPTQYFCSTSRCDPLKDGKALYWDTHHVTSSAARDYGSRFLR